MAIAVLIGLWLALAASGTDQARAPLTNDDVLNLVRAGFSQAVVLTAVEINIAAFDTSGEALQTLKRYGVSDAVLAAMVRKARRATSKTPQSSSLLDPGVYVKRGETYIDLASEVVKWRQLAEEPVSAELARVRFAGHAPGSHSPILVVGRVELLIVSPPGVSSSGYLLLRAEEADEDRQFRVEAAVRRGTFLAFSGIEKQRITVDVDTSFDLGVRVTAALRSGEYGVLLPDAIRDIRVGGGDKLHTFSVQ